MRGEIPKAKGSNTPSKYGPEDITPEILGTEVGHIEFGGPTQGKPRVPSSVRSSFTFMARHLGLGTANGTQELNWKGYLHTPD